MTSHYLFPFFHQCRIPVRSLSVSLYNPTTLLKKKCEPYSCQKYWNYVFENENMTVNSRYIRWMNEHLYSRFVYIANIDVFSPTFQWYDVMTTEFGRERLVQCPVVLLSPQCGDTTSCIRQATFVNFKGKCRC
jgi:hypothetical protein